jgi:hypothetical protein
MGHAWPSWATTHKWAHPRPEGCCTILLLGPQPSHSPRSGVSPKYLARDLAKIAALPSLSNAWVKDTGAKHLVVRGMPCVNANGCTDPLQAPVRDAGTAGHGSPSNSRHRPTRTSHQNIWGSTRPVERRNTTPRYQGCRHFQAPSASSAGRRTHPRTVVAIV